MLNGLYSSATALDVLSQQQEAIASNLAHLNTPGHRRMVFSLVEQTAAGDPNEAVPGVKIQKQSADFTPGRMEPTGRQLDLALNGDGFFVYQGAEGPMYSRSGVVFRDAESNELRNSNGFPLVGDGGTPVTYDGAISDLVIGSDGTISQAGQNQSLGKISIVSFDDNQLLESESQTYFRAGQATIGPAENVSVLQGSRELSNASSMNELISLIVGSRQFEASQRAIRMISDAMQESIRG